LTAWYLYIFYFVSISDQSRRQTILRGFQFLSCGNRYNPNKLSIWCKKQICSCFQNDDQNHHDVVEDLENIQDEERKILLEHGNNIPGENCHGADDDQENIQDGEIESLLERGIHIPGENCHALIEDRDNIQAGEFESFVDHEINNPGGSHELKIFESDVNRENTDEQSCNAETEFRLNYNSEDFPLNVESLIKCDGDLSDDSSNIHQKIQQIMYHFSCVFYIIRCNYYGNDTNQNLFSIKQLLFFHQIKRVY